MFDWLIEQFMGSKMSELIKSVSIEAVLMRHDVVRQRFEEMIQSIESFVEEAKAMELHVPVQSALQKIDYCSLEPMASVRAEFDRSMTRAGWWHVLKGTGLYDCMSSTRRAQWSDTLNSKHSDVAAFSLDTVVATFDTLISERAALMEEGVVEAYRRLSWDFKSHLPTRLGKKIITTHNTYGMSTVLKDHALHDLLRAFYRYDGKPHPDFRDQCSVERFAEYIDVKLFKNGNAHIIFKRPDLVDKLNAVIARHYPSALPAPRA
ncbi:DUF4942 domain-containing protein [Stenotrophomonas sp. S39]|uniref:DUF4942 domain-containing protein n=1 Tax=Stenotrophomonas sp. S39 TaxID=2767451 RepID=UPI00190B1001|nr:DUF4942 domain-containing protein [Stenotrophomonas sp. S39]MBK0052996.1 DUF4942 domain-containing protein [Stenotrophomonas sp. S39]